MVEIDVKKDIKAAEGHRTLHFKTTINAGQITAVYGKSGAGKTTLLRMLAGLTKPNEGKILFKEKPWFDSTKGINTKPQQRKVGFVFQDYALFPNMTIRKNLEFAAGSNHDPEKIAQLLYETALENLQDSYPFEISGGQKQRVALARALAANSEMLLLDEPLSALDVEMRNQLQELLLRLYKKYKFMALLVSHDLLEISRLASRVLVIEDYKIHKEGSPEAVLNLQPIEEQFNYFKKLLTATT